MKNKPIFDEKLPRVSPLDFGAVGDGKTDDSEALRKAIAYAAEQKCVLSLGNRDYYCLQPTVLENVTVLSDHAKISYYGLTLNKPAVDVRDNTDIFGVLRVFSVDNGLSNHGGRCGVLFGDYESGAGAVNCYVESLEITGGFRGTNAVLATGSSHDIRIGRIYVPKGTKYARAFLAHWGNSADHMPVDHTDKTKGYTHVADWKPTTHPHDILVERVICEGFDEMGEGEAAVVLSAAYGITVEEIVIDNTTNAVAMIPGDAAFLFASEEEQKNKMCDIHFGKIKATNLRSAAIFVMSFSSYAPYPNACVYASFDEIDCEGMEGKNTYALACHEALGEITVNRLYAKGLSHQAVHCGKGTKNVTVHEMTLTDCAGEAVVAYKKPDEAREENLRFGKIKLIGNQSPCAVVRANDVKGLSVGRVEMTDCAYRSLFLLGGETEAVSAEGLIAHSSQLEALVYADTPISSTYPVHIGCVEGVDVPLSGGAECTVTVG